MEKSFYCSEPYKQIHFNSKGNLGPCCQYTGERLEFNSFDEYLESDWLKNLKEQLNNGNRINGCKFCWRQEDSGVKSMRQRRNIFYEGKNDKGIEHIMITFGNQCNTACRICNPSRSSLIEKQNKEIKNYIKDPKLFELIDEKYIWKKTKTWYSNITDDIVNRIEDIHLLEITGGEPFINVHFDKLIDNLIDSGKPLSKIRITTNGSFEDSQIKKLEKFKNIHINFSLDGTGELFYEYLRWPLKWDDIIKKIDILKTYPWITCNFVIVPHNLNLLNLVDSIIWLKQYTEYNKRFKIMFSWLNGVPWYNIDNSPKWVRKQVVSQIENIKLDNLSPREKEQLNELLNIIQKSNNPSHLNILKSHIEVTDQYRNSNTWETIGWKYEDII
jgi:wyosine [tRNA(Phe)-imidazoG37] synthetase (radical SAM superfamily)